MQQPCLFKGGMGAASLLIGGSLTGLSMFFFEGVSITNLIQFWFGHKPALLVIPHF